MDPNETLCEVIIMMTWVVPGGVQYEMTKCPFHNEFRITGVYFDGEYHGDIRYFDVHMLKIRSTAVECRTLFLE